MSRSLDSVANTKVPPYPSQSVRPSIRVKRIDLMNHKILKNGFGVVGKVLAILAQSHRNSLDWCSGSVLPSYIFKFNFFNCFHSIIPTPVAQKR